MHFFCHCSVCLSICLVVLLVLWALLPESKWMLLLLLLNIGHVDHVVAGTALVSIKGVHRARLVMGSVTVCDLCDAASNSSPLTIIPSVGQ